MVDAVGGRTHRKVCMHNTSAELEPAGTADWVEHALATQGEAYLATPEADMTFVERHNLDIIATVTLCGGAVAVGALIVLQFGVSMLFSAARNGRKAKAA